MSARYWLSWHQPTGDYRPLTYPPNEAILGWWCSGYTNFRRTLVKGGEETGADIAVLCALVQADDEDAAKAAIVKDWPEAATAEWRFVNCHDDEWLPGDRFPLGDWMKARMPEGMRRRA
jgi:hypothetical protein